MPGEPLITGDNLKAFKPLQVLQCHLLFVANFTTCAHLGISNSKTHSIQDVVLIPTPSSKGPQGTYVHATLNIVDCSHSPLTLYLAAPFTTPFMKSVPFESSTVSTPGSGVLCPPNPPPTPQGGVGGVPVPPPPPPTLPGAGSSQTHLKRVNWEKVHSTEGTIWREVGAAWKEEIELYIINKC